MELPKDPIFHHLGCPQILTDKVAFYWLMLGIFYCKFVGVHVRTFTLLAPGIYSGIFLLCVKKL